MKAIFTICAKNYLAQALTLRQSVLDNNDDVDFFFFLADDNNGIEIDNLYPVCSLNIENWQNMAFKYNVIEFATSIKPFCFLKLFSLGYQKVLYLDPDIFVTDKLSYIWNSLDNKSIILTPHYLDIAECFSGAVPESVFNRDGIFNLGFVGINNNEIGNSIAKWWRSRLKDQCYSDINEATFTDQKWMDFVPDFVPDDLEVCRHFGVNVAIWNLHERELLHREGKFFIRRIGTGEEYPLLFYHFSGFNPYENDVINWRHPDFTVKSYPSFEPLIEVYRRMIFDNGYDLYSKMKYAYDTFDNGVCILSINRRLYRVMLDEGKIEQNVDPFLSEGLFYQLMKKRHLISRKKNADNMKPNQTEIDKGQRIADYFVYPLFKFLLRIMGVNKYELLLGLCRRLGHLEYNVFLLR